MMDTRVDTAVTNSRPPTGGDHIAQRQVDDNDHA